MYIHTYHIHKHKTWNDIQYKQTYYNTGLPWIWLDLQTGKIDTTKQQSCPAVAGTHTLEYGIMSILSGDMKYWNASTATCLIGYGIY